MVEGGLAWLERFLAAIVDDVRKDLPIWTNKRRAERREGSLEVVGTRL